MTGCAALTEADTPKSKLRQRVMDRWATLIEGKLETAYTYETPEYRGVYSFSDFRRPIKGVGRWKKVDIEKISCKQEICSVDVRIYVSMKVGLVFGNVETNASSTENWIQDGSDEQWYHVSDH